MNQPNKTTQPSKAMGPIAALNTCFHKYFDFTGRASRSEFWWFLLSFFFFTHFAGFLGLDWNSVFWIWFCPTLAVTTRRLRDAQYSTWLLLCLLLPAVLAFEASIGESYVRLFIFQTTKQFEGFVSFLAFVIASPALWLFFYPCMKKSSLESGDFNLRAEFAKLDRAIEERSKKAGSVEQYRKAAEQGDARAQCQLADMYDTGTGVVQDRTEATRLYRLAAEQGDAKAQFSLGVGTINEWPDGSNGTPQDITKAITWIRRAAKQGFTAAQATLGDRYFRGRDGVPRDYVQAYFWLSIASANDGLAKHLKFTVAEQMTKEQIAEAKKLMRDFKPKKEL